MADPLSGAQARIDGSGIRQGVDRPLTPRMADFPYDRDVSYGSPQDYDRGSAHGSELHGPLVPANAERNPWEELGEEMGMQDEASGTPISFSISSRQGSYQGGIAPGASRGWAGPTKDDLDPSSFDVLEADLVSFLLGTEPDVMSRPSLPRIADLLGTDFDADRGCLTPDDTYPGGPEDIGPGEEDVL